MERDNSSAFFFERVFHAVALLDFVPQKRVGRGQVGGPDRHAFFQIVVRFLQLRFGRLAQADVARHDLDRRIPFVRRARAGHFDGNFPAVPRDDALLGKRRGFARRENALGALARQIAEFRRDEFEHRAPEKLLLRRRAEHRHSRAVDETNFPSRCTKIPSGDISTRLRKRSSLSRTRRSDRFIAVKIGWMSAMPMSI
ncbi:MAG: hypothetical protein M5R36_03160, partial [Deltaproteobacteria bacterium]|nr:hypothetical protein [Deltaproteobacteria bacterium]